MTAPSPEKAVPIQAESFTYRAYRIICEAAGPRQDEWSVFERAVMDLARNADEVMAKVLADREARSSRFGCMCQDVEIGSHDVSVRLTAPPHMQDYSANRVAAGLSPDIAVDACLVGEIRHLWSKGIRTYGCCCGHNKVRGMINVHDDDAEAMRSMGYEQWPIEEGKHPWTFYPRSTEARSSLPDSREERIIEDVLDRLYAKAREDRDRAWPDPRAWDACEWLSEEGAMFPADRARARQGGNNG